MTKLRISVLPLLLILIAGAVYFFFFTDQDLVDFKKEPEVRRLNGFPAISYVTKEQEKQRVVIKSDEELANFINSVDESGFLTIRENINFDKEYLLGVSSSTNAFTGGEIKIRKLYEDKEGGKLIVSVKETEAGKTCAEIEEKMNVTVDLVAISKTDYAIEFERVKEVEECD